MYPVKVDLASISSRPGVFKNKVTPNIQCLLMKVNIDQLITSMKKGSDTACGNFLEIAKPF